MIIRMDCSAVIFDMDGLMLDTERVYREIFRRAAIDCQIDFPPSFPNALLGRNTVDMKRILRDQIKDQELFDRFMDRNRHHHETCFIDAPPIKHGLLELLDFLEKIPKVVATSSPRKAALARLEQCDLLHRFASISCGDEVERGKPFPDLFLLAASIIPADPARCIVLEDSEAGVIGAHAAGMKVCMIPDMMQPSQNVRQLAHGVYESLIHVRDLLQKG
jgi:HAD superfamily hydrolase (TIGR01509 family)